MTFQKQYRLIATLAASFLLIAYCLYNAARIGLDADAISPFSFARDVLRHVPISTWNFPAPTFIFPDVLVSIPITYFFKTPEKWFYASACLQWFALVFIVLAYARTQFNLKNKIHFAGIVYIGLLANKLGDHLFSAPWMVIATRMYVLVNHMSAALMALAFYLWFSSLASEKKTFSKWGLLALFSLGGFSDLFLMLYFFSFIAASILINYKKITSDFAWIRKIVVFFIAGMLGVSLNAYVNPNFWVQLHNSYQTTPVSQHLIHLLVLLHGNGIALVIVLPLLLMFFVKKSTLQEVQKKLAYSLLLGLLVFLSGVALTGMIGDRYAFRYFSIYFPVIIFIIAILLPNAYYNLMTHLVFSIIALYLSFTYIHRFLLIKHDIYSLAPQRVLDCPAFLQNRDGALVVSTYWPAKILYEKSNRIFRLEQKDNDLTNIRHWIYNPSWANKEAMRTTNLTNKILYVTSEVSDARIKTLISNPHAQVICDGLVIMVNENKHVE